MNLIDSPPVAAPVKTTTHIALTTQIAVRVAEGAMLLLAAAFLCLHAVHLQADFPNYSPWMDWSKYTDEGWYGDAAIRHYSRGNWYVPGDFNPAVALPVWPLLEAIVFRFTGVSLTAARALTVAVFGLILLVSYLLLRRFSQNDSPDKVASLVPAAGVLLLSVSPFCFVFTRMAILEPLLILLTLLALLTASHARTAEDGVGLSRWRRWTPAVSLGVLLPLMILTKTTALFLFPSIAWVLWARLGYRLRPLLRFGGIAAGLGATLWIGYYVILVRPRFLPDYLYLFSANAYTAMTIENAGQVLHDTIVDGKWMGRILFPMAMLAAFVAVTCWRRFGRQPLVVSLLLWAGGYAAFLAYHANLQPRYYLVLAVPLTLLVPAVFGDFWGDLWGVPKGDLGGEVRVKPVNGRTALDRAGLLATAGALAVVVLTDARQTIHYVRHPEYTFVTAARNIQQIVRSDRSQSQLVLSISGSNLSLITGLPSICDDFGTMELPDRVAFYRPGWYASWNQVEDDKMDAFAPRFHLERVAAFPAMDDPDRNLLILYRIEPGERSNRRQGGRGRRPIPHVLRTRMGQQPSAMQLVH